MNLERDSARRTALLYTMMIVAAAAVMVFSIIGIATMMEWLPNSSGDEPRLLRVRDARCGACAHRARRACHLRKHAEHCAGCA
jgi:hypothetical protein